MGMASVMLAGESLRTAPDKPKLSQQAGGFSCGPIRYTIGEVFETPMTAPPTATAPTMRVLVVDDEPNIRDTLGMCLETIGCRVEKAATGAAALEALRIAPYDVAFCDLRLGGESGLDLVPQMLAERPGLDVVLITAYATVDTAVEA